MGEGKPAPGEGSPSAGGNKKPNQADAHCSTPASEGSDLATITFSLEDTWKFPGVPVKAAFADKYVKKVSVAIEVAVKAAFECKALPGAEKEEKGTIWEKLFENLKQGGMYWDPSTWKWGNVTAKGPEIGGSVEHEKGKSEKEVEVSVGGGELDAGPLGKISIEFDIFSFSPPKKWSGPKLAAAITREIKTPEFHPFTNWTCSEGSIEVAVKIEVVPNFTALWQLAGDVAWEFSVADIALATIPLIVAKSFIDLESWLQEYQTLLSSVLPTETDYINGFRWGLSALCPAENAWKDRNNPGSAPPTSVDSSNTPRAQGIAAGAIVRDKYWVQYVQENADAVNSKIDKARAADSSLTYEAAQATAMVSGLDTFADGMESRIDDIVNENQPNLMTTMKSQLYDAYFAEHSSDHIAGIALFLAWFCTDGTWVKNIPVSSVNNYKTFAGSGGYSECPSSSIAS